MSRLYLSVNQPPDAGFCVVTPTTGVTKETVFSLICDEWEDDQGIATYIVTGNSFLL